MGFDPSRFAGPVAAELQCRLCGRVLEEPLSTPCGHVFCAGCLLPWAARRRRCPLRCRPLAAAELRPVLPLRSLVQKLEVKCDYSPRGCGRTVRLRELPAHLAACRYGPAATGTAEPQPRGGRTPGRPRAEWGQRCLRALRGGGSGGGPEAGAGLKREALPLALAAEEQKSGVIILVTYMGMCSFTMHYWWFITTMQVFPIGKQVTLGDLGNVHTYFPLAVFRFSP
uniref:RING-type domain-containing protein n=1 Tax=Calidris pygmaea TaxID=425635 RepID=A0A8C3JRF3_9CHAR